MKWIKGNNRIILVALCMLCSCSYSSEKELVTGKWKYKQITKNNEMFIRITDEDFLVLNSDSTFQYTLNFIGSKKQGYWNFKNHILTLKYTNPDTVRNFVLDRISRKELIFSENNIQFEFIKE